MAKAKKLPSGNWRVQVYDKNTGKYKSFTATTKKEAEYKAAEYSLHANSGNSYEDMTLREAFERYIKSKSAVLSPSTIKEYTRSSEHDFTYLMPMRLSKITPELVQTAINELSAELSPKTVRNRHGLLHSVLKAYRPALILNTRLPQKVKVEVTIPTTKEIQMLLNNADEVIRVPILLASSGGLRRSEICALTPNDFNDFGVNINKAVVMDKDCKKVCKAPKTSAGYRFVPLPKDVIAEAEKWKHFQLAPNVLYTHFHKLVESLPIPHITFHKLRHYFASELHAQGIPDQYIAQIGGWETVEMLHKIYQHTLRDKEKEMSDKIVGIFSNNFTDSKVIQLKQKTAT
jgi:integrase